MRKSFNLVVSALALSLALSGCGEGPEDASVTPQIAPTVAGATRINPQKIIDGFFQDQIWCTGFRESDSSCTSVQKIVRRTEDGMVLNHLTIYPDGATYGKQLFSQRLVLKDNMLCRDPDDDSEINTRTFFFSYDRNAEISDFDKEAAQSPDENVRRSTENILQEMRDEKARERLEVCWAYFRADEKAEGGGDRIFMLTFINGIQQPFDRGDNFGIFFTPDSTFILREPDRG